MQSYQSIGRDLIKDGNMDSDAVYLNPFAILKQWFTPYRKTKEKNFWWNTVMLTKVKLNSINDVALPDIASNKLR